MNGFLRAVPLALAAMLGAASKPAANFTPADWTRRAVIYEINVRQYTPEGTLAALTRRLAHIDSLGADILWVMPVQPIGVKNRKGSLGSYYSIRDYDAINGEFGGNADFKAFVDAAHKRGKHVVLDWVANHTSFDHAWITQHPDWYVHKPDGSIMNARDDQNRETDWTDVAELNYDNRAMRQAMIAAMRWWVDTMHIDGFRCDVAGGVPIDFWIEARTALDKVKPGLFWLAEAEGPQFHRAFDMTYGWELHHLLNAIAQGKDSVGALDAYEAKEERTYPRDAYRMYFTSNHDENSWNGSELERMHENHLPAFILAATMEQGMPLVYSGQEASMQKRLRFFDKDTITWSGPSLVRFYRSVADLRHSTAALANGANGGPEVKLATTGGARTYAFTRTRGTSTVLVAVNFGDAPATVSYRALPVTGAYTDWFDKMNVTLAAQGTLPIPAHGYRVLVR